MSFQQTVQTLRSNADTLILEDILSSIVGHEDIAPREHLHELLWPELSTNDDIRREQLPQVLSQYQEQLEGYCRRYDELRTRGLEALSDYDIGIAYRGIGPERGLAEALRMVANHVACTRAQVAWLEAEQARLVLPQLALF